MSQDFANFDEGGQDAEWSALSNPPQNNATEDLFGGVQMNSQPTGAASLASQSSEVDDYTPEERQLV